MARTDPERKVDVGRAAKATAETVVEWRAEGGAERVKGRRRTGQKLAKLRREMGWERADVLDRLGIGPGDTDAYTDFLLFEHGVLPDNGEVAEWEARLRRVLGKGE